MANLKKLAHKYYKEMSSDSKCKSAEAERKLCKILNHIITKMEKSKLQLTMVFVTIPKEFTKWNMLDIIMNYLKYWSVTTTIIGFLDLKLLGLICIKYTIEKVEQSLVKHREKLQKLSESKFSDIEFSELVLNEEG